MSEQRCGIQGCPNTATGTSSYCGTCRNYLKRVEKMSLAWRTVRLETVTRWGTRLELALSRKGTVTHIRSKKRARA